MIKVTKRIDNHYRIDIGLIVDVFEICIILWHDVIGISTIYQTPNGQSNMLYDRSHKSDDLLKIMQTIQQEFPSCELIHNDLHGMTILSFNKEETLEFRMLIS